jgi:hypothetical protein
VQEVAVVQRLQAEVAELQVALASSAAPRRQVELQQLVVEQLGFDARLMNCGKYSA